MANTTNPPNPPNILSCYCIENTLGTKTYIGATQNFNIRLSQHNGEKSGGAKATKGSQWHPIIIVRGFETRRQLLQFEWWWKHAISKKETTSRGLFRRIDYLETLLEKKEWHHLTVYTIPSIACFLSIPNNKNQLEPLEYIYPDLTIQPPPS
jgi:predicted GIY-YIG superfamily endonuclease